jgi:hypothetical protein
MGPKDQLGGDAFLVEETAEEMGCLLFIPRWIGGVDLEIALKPERWPFERRLAESQRKEGEEGANKCWN